MLGTLRRRGGQWRAEHGEKREICFAQEHPPGRLGLSDFTVADTLDISLGGLAFPRRLYQFVLVHSRWRHVRVVLGGESFPPTVAGASIAKLLAVMARQEQLFRPKPELQRPFIKKFRREFVGRSYETTHTQGAQGRPARQPKVKA